MRPEARPSLAAVARTAAFGSGILAASTSWNHFSNCRKGSRARSFSDSPASVYSFLRSARVISWHAVFAPPPCQRHLSAAGGASAGERADDGGVRRELANERLPAPQLEVTPVPCGRDRAGEERPAARIAGPGRQDAHALPFAGGHDGLGRVASRHVRPEHARAAGRVPRVEPEELRGI